MKTDRSGMRIGLFYLWPALERSESPVRAASEILRQVPNPRRNLCRARLLQHTRHNRETGTIMRSELVYSAGLQIENRFLLATVVMRAVRKLHVQATRTEDTANRVLSDVAQGMYAPEALPEPVPAPAIEPLLIAPAA